MFVNFCVILTYLITNLMFIIIDLKRKSADFEFFIAE